MDCKWSSFIKFNGSCSADCGYGELNWMREKTVNESNCGVCKEPKDGSKGTVECYECDEIGNIYIYRFNHTIISVTFR